MKPQWQARRVTALIAEDEPMLRAQLRTRLLQAWPELEIVAEAENGEQALALATELEPEIAFLDIRMPVKDGLTSPQPSATPATSSSSPPTTNTRSTRSSRARSTMCSSPSRPSASPSWSTG